MLQYPTAKRGVIVTAAAATTLAGVAVILERTALASPHYHGPVSDHFNGSQFYNPSPRERGQDSFLKWQLTREVGYMNQSDTWLLQHPPRQ